MTRYALIAVIAATAGVHSTVVAQEVAPARGALVVAGGGIRDRAILERFLGLAGGADAPIVVIPTAGEAESYDQYWPGLGPFKEAGATRVTVLHTRERDAADAAGFAEPLREARGVWFSGGRQWRLADAYLGTTVEHEVRAVLDRGGVVGGSSAGATILGSYLVRGDTATNTVMMGDHEEGFGLLRGVAIDQHLLRRNRQFDLLEVIENRPDLLGIGIDEDTAIVVEGDEFEVIGQSYVAIYDHERRLDTGGRFYFLAPGDRYDLRTREPFRPAERREPLERVTRSRWSPR